MNTFFYPVRELAGYKTMESMMDEQGNTAMVSGCIESQKVHFIHSIAEKFRYRIIISHDESKAREIYDDCRFFNKNVVYYPAKDFIFYTADVHGNLLMQERMKVIREIYRAREKETAGLTIVTTIDGCAEMLLPIERIIENILFFEEEQQIQISELTKKLVNLGYERMGQVETNGQFAVRGGIIDIFPLTEENPVRIELWDDEIDSIRIFDAESQRSIEKVKKVAIFPASDMIFTPKEVTRGLRAIEEEVKKQSSLFKTENNYEAVKRLQEITEMAGDQSSHYKFVHFFTDHTVSFAEYFDREDTLFVLDEPNRLKDRMNLIEFEFNQSMDSRLENGYILPGQSNMLYGINEIYAILNTRKLVVLSTLEYKPELLNINRTFRLDCKSVSVYNNKFQILIEDLKKYKKSKYRIIVVSSSRSRALRLAQDFRDYDLLSYFSEDYNKELTEGEIMVTYGNLHRGFEYPLLKFVVIAESDIFGKEKKSKKKRKKYTGKEIAAFSELSIGDFVIHENHGLGIYRGIEKVTVEGVEKDYIKLEYAQNGILYVLATQLDMLQKYSGADSRVPKLNKLGGSEWNKTKARVHGVVEAIAKDLVELYAKRQQQVGHQFGEDTVWQQEFEELFPYEETEDQLAAIADVKRDMESKKIMDRLICGDVGYGKTEVAIRAAFKAVQEGKQVAYLVPTTILAQQHFNTFEQRMKDFPIRVALLCRFRTAKEVKETLEALKKGLVDIVIGTHRLLSKDITFRELGLLIIDEEQRFGVTHKEKIKRLKENVDVLTLSATPIPRTLHMSLAGIRDMSVLEEPPVDRLPIQTFVTEYNDEIVREAMKREINRGGQVYYVYNRVKSISETAEHLKELMPEANIEFAHGQMNERALEKIMYEFISGEIDVLVSTTIIETGLDIPNVNTIIIEDSDKFGLSQLYQLRGRVGRSNRTSYAFLLYKRDKMLKEIAEKRLHAIKEFTEFGSGFKIAMKDLELRGAGNVLGEKQHGHMEAVGYDLYCKMLNESVNQLKGIETQDSFETTVDLNVSAYIPSDYIKSELQKLDVYKRITGIENENELMDMQDELIDRFGELPQSALNLLNIALIKSMAHRAGITEIKERTAAINRAFVIKIFSKIQFNSQKIIELMNKYENALKYTAGDDYFFTFTVNKKECRQTSDVLAALKELIDEISKCRPYS